MKEKKLRNLGSMLSFELYDMRGGTVEWIHRENEWLKGRYTAVGARQGKYSCLGIKPILRA